MAQEVSAREPEVKAAFLYNFSKLVYWPTNAFAASNSPVVIGILGRDPVAKELERMIEGRAFNGREIKAARFDSVEDITNCHVLFISDTERRKLESILNKLQSRPILTVGETKGFAENGVIELIKTNSNIHFRINLDAAKRAGLQLSSHLTRLDRTLQPPVTPPTQPPARPK